MKVSIITTSYNSAATIADTLNSVREQDYPDIEHIIIDGKSTDKTVQIVETFPHVAKLISEKDKGIYDAMNKGLNLVTGNIIAILNSDDIYSNSSVISKVVNCFAKSETETIFGDLQYVSEKDLNKVIRTWRSGHFKKKNFYYGWMPPHPAFFVRKEVYEKVGLFNTELKSAADYEMMLRILLKNHCTSAYLPEILVKMRTGGMSNASFRHRLKANDEDRLAWKMNNLQPYFFTRYAKPLRKLGQFFIKG